MTSERRLREYHKESGATHFYSSRSVLPILEHIKKTAKGSYEVVLSKQHAITAYLLVFEELPKKSPVPSTFVSLGTALPITIGRAFLNRDTTFHVVMGDGEWDEGSNWESYLLMKRLGLRNIVIHIDANGMKAMGNTEGPFPDDCLVYSTYKGADWTCHYRNP